MTELRICSTQLLFLTIMLHQPQIGWLVVMSARHNWVTHRLTMLSLDLLLAVVQLVIALAVLLELCQDTP